MKIALGSDHRGDTAIGQLATVLRATGHEIMTVGPCDGTSRDYPDEAYLVGRAVSSGQADRGILICGSGIGVSIAANKVPGIRAALACSAHGAEMSRKHNNANVLCLSGDALSQEIIEEAALAWLNAEFEGGRHERRVNKITAIEQGHDPATITPDAKR
jgi:ribose 5-phosphate isomerase B